MDHQPMITKLNQDISSNSSFTECTDIALSSMVCNHFCLRVVINIEFSLKFLSCNES